MAETVRVVANGVDFYAEIQDDDGLANVGLDDVLSFDGVRRTIEGIASELLSAWQVVRPSEASVEFSLTLKVREGKLTGLLVSGGAEGSLMVTLNWKEQKDDGHPGVGA